MDFVNFAVDDSQYAVRLDETIKIMLLPDITVGFGTISDVVCGMFSYEFELIPVVDLALLYFQTLTNSPKYVIILQGKIKFAIMAASVNDIIRNNIPIEVTCLSVYDIESAVMQQPSTGSKVEKIELF